MRNGLTPQCVLVSLLLAALSRCVRLTSNDMSIELESLVFLEATPGAGPLHIKVDQERGPILSFKSAEVANYFTSRWGFEATMLKAAQLASGVVGVGELFVFETVEEVDAAQQNAATYDFARHLRAWPQS